MSVVEPHCTTTRGGEHRLAEFRGLAEVPGGPVVAQRLSGGHVFLSGSHQESRNARGRDRINREQWNVATLLLLHHLPVPCRVLGAGNRRTAGTRSRARRTLRHE